MAIELLSNSEVKYKECSSCKALLPVTSFWKKRTNKDGRYGQCIPCQRTWFLEWRAKNPDKMRQKAERWKKKHPKYQAEWQRRNPGKHRAANARYHARNILEEKPPLNTIKKCTKCGEDKPRREFWVATNKRDGRFHHCVACTMRAKRFRFYEVSPERFVEMWLAQEGRCGACAEELKEHGKGGCVIDHCHDTGRVRGLLCSPCNLAIGHLKDDPRKCEAAGRYLRRFGSETYAVE